MAQRLHSSTSLIEGMSAVAYNPSSTRKRELELKIQESRPVPSRFFGLAKSSLYILHARML